MLTGVLRFYQSIFSGKSFMQWAPWDNNSHRMTPHQDNCPLGQLPIRTTSLSGLKYVFWIHMSAFEMSNILLQYYKMKPIISYIPYKTT